jgi:hypothetical protein
MLIPPHRTSTNLDSLPDGEVHRFVGHNNIASLRKRGDHTADCGEGLRVNNACRGTEMGSDVGLGLDVHVLVAVEARGSAGTDAVGAQCGNGLLFQNFVGGEIIEIIRGQVGYGAAVGELGFGTCWTAQVLILARPRSIFIACGRFGCSYPTMTGLFSASASSNCEGAATSGSGVQSSTNSSISSSLSPIFLVCE